MKKVYIDLDSTLNNLLYAWLDWVNSKHNTNIKPQDVRHWNYIQDKLGEGVFDFFHTKPWLNSIKPLEGSQECLKQLREKYDVTILSHTTGNHKREKEEHIRKYYGDVAFILTEEEKCDIVKDNILIDDKFDSIYGVVKKGGYGILFNNNSEYGYADFLMQNYRYYTANSYARVIEAVTKIQGKEYENDDTRNK